MVAPRTTVRYAPAQADQARELASLLSLPSAALTPDGPADAGPLTLTVGQDFTGPGRPVAVPSPAAERPVVRRPSPAPQQLPEVRAADRGACVK